MADVDYVREYFSAQAAGWVRKAYEEPAAYPVGVQRVRLALEAVAERQGRSCRLVDLGCGGGELCIDAARIGMRATGIDIAEGMISEANNKREQLDDRLRDRLAFKVGNVLQTGLPSGDFDAAAAIGLVEYLPDDDDFLLEARRLLHPGGSLVVSCRNRLFNMASLNRYTEEEVEGGAATKLLAEIPMLQSDRLPAEVLRRFAAGLEDVLPELEEAIARDEEVRGNGEMPADRVGAFAQQRRQHTPAELAASAEKAGFQATSFWGAHPHPLAPGLEKQNPHFYNRLARLFEVFEHLPQSLLWSSTFVAVLVKTG